jgi:hypothetical protein
MQVKSQIEKQFQSLIRINTSPASIFQSRFDGEGLESRDGQVDESCGGSTIR